MKALRLTEEQYPRLQKKAKVEPKPERTAPRRAPWGERRV
jgi:hypothetical protein